MTITIGADPEFFLMQNGVPVSAHGLVPGTKWQPHVVENGAVQVDGTAVEFNIQPASNVDEFVSSIGGMLASLRAMIPQEYGFAFTPSVRYDPTYFAAIPEDAKMLGCEPDFNAYTGTLSEMIDPDAHGSLRTSAGHIHVGFLDKPEDEDSFEDHLWTCMNITRQLDFFLGIPSIVMTENDRAKELARRRMYGKAGAFRPKLQYGLEYRTLSSFWLENKDRVHWIFAQTQLALNEQEFGERLYDRYGEVARGIVDDHDVSGAKQFVRSMKWELP